MSSVKRPGRHKALGPAQEPATGDRATRISDIIHQNGKKIASRPGITEAVDTPTLSGENSVLIDHRAI